jgi:hypothetical protein
MLPDGVNFDGWIIKFDWLQELDIAAFLCIHLQSQILHSFFSQLASLNPKSFILLKITFLLVIQFLKLSDVILQTLFFFTAYNVGFVKHVVVAQLLIGWSSWIVGIRSDWSLKFAFLRYMLVVYFLIRLISRSYEWGRAFKIFQLAEWDISWIQLWSWTKFDFFLIKILYFLYCRIFIKSYL